MSEPVFKLQIVRRDGTVVVLPGGGPLERDLIASCTDAIVAKGVGIFRTEAQVRKAVSDGIAEAVMALKVETRAAL